ncbi:hypothetical protein B0T22DRAFT_268688 [Podospora appendiculata]|uniref:Box C/D snoRNA protein 1 n=1 Tax=Podospora appendiculata TaxID=314037 RepID=A0AAE0X3A6_9PEZI|nr:hypothetical protein B0T22DRAFT_268688 [Podospora appendiculata]
MSETLLSALCSICHAQPPKYKCPRCGARTCSLACIQKHKTRADCDGIRNPTAYVPISQLRTAAGVDHDYNFIASIERARQRSERDIIEGRRLLSEKDLRPENEDKKFLKEWHGDELHHVPVTFQPRGRNPREALAGEGAVDKHVRRRQKQLDIDAKTMPKGMVRRTENKTAWNRRTQTVNWQVEWLVYNLLGGEPGQSSQPPQQQPTRILHKTLEGTPLNTALLKTLEWHRGQLDHQSREDQGNNEEDNEPDSDADEDQQSKKKRKPHWKKKKTQEVASSDPTQDPSGTWPSSSFTVQHSLTGAWSHTSQASPITRDMGEEAVTFSGWQYFLTKIGRSAPGTTELIPLLPSDTLTSALSGRTVVEFPTIYILPPAMALPQGLVIADNTERRKRKAKADLEEVEAEEGEAADDSQRKERPGRSNTWSQKQEFERDQRDQRKQQQQQQQQSTRGSARGGRGGKRVKFEPPPPPPPPIEVEVEVDEGEINSDGDEVMADTRPDEEPARLLFSEHDLKMAAESDLCDDPLSRRRNITWGNGFEQQQQQQQPAPFVQEQPYPSSTGPSPGLGLVDYDSSGDD